ncbi:MAG: GNAT family N-acetyltransferase [Clostridia bacterium]|nr:GNAT family N-acetyltransferase [Clostridia bacterium]
MKVIYETERLIVRQWENKDEQDLYEYASDNSVTKFLTFPTYQSLQDAKERIAYLQQQYQEKSLVQDYCIEHKGLHKVIGAIGIPHYFEKMKAKLKSAMY